MNSTLHFRKVIGNLFKKSSLGICAWFFVLLFFQSQSVQAQISAYVFDESNTALTYSPITGTSLFPIGAWNDNVPANVTIPFTFNFNGTGYTTANVSPNGFITFGATAPATTTYNPIGATTAYAGAISAFGQNLASGSPTSSVSHTTLGTSPNRVFVVQYSDVDRFAIVGDGIMNFQIRLYESSNIIETWYDVPSTLPTGGSNFGPWGGQIGLRGINNVYPGNVNNRNYASLSANWIPTSPGANSAQFVFVKNTSYNNFVTRFRWTPPCYAPSGLTAINLTNSTADISWTAPAIAPAGYQYEVRSSGAAGSGAIGLGASGTLAGTSTTATGLAEGFTYTLYVRSNCGGSNNSGWITGPTFTMPCAAATVPYFLYFDPGTDGFTVPALPVCTVNNNAGAGNNWVTTADGDGGFFDEHLRYTFNPTFPANTWFITKGINLVAGTTYRLSYVYGGSSEFTYITNKMEVRYGTTGTAAGLAGATQLDDHNNIKTSSFLNVVNFTATTSGVHYFGFRAYSDANNGSLFLDDIEVTVSNCLQPTGLTAPPVLISFNNATITWTAPIPAPANGYAYYVSTTNTPPTNLTPATGTVPAGTTLTAIPSLTPNTTYYVWVRGICAPGEFGEWSASTTFTTLPAPPVYCTPTGTSVDGTGLTNVTFGSINNTTGNEAGTAYYGNYSGFTTNVAQGATVPVTLTFSTSVFDYFVKIWVDWNNDGDFVDGGEEVYSGVTLMPSPSVLNASFVVPLAQPLGPRRMRIGGIDDPIYTGGALTPCRNGSFQTFEDYTINVIVAPPALTLSQTTIPVQCGLTNSPLITITSVLSDYDVYTWSPAFGVTGTPSTGYTFNTSVTTTYTLTASQTSGAFSTNTVTFTYLANETPTPITILTPNGTVACASGPGIQLNATGGIVANLTVYEENFNSGIDGVGQFTSTNGSTGGVSPANAAWTVRPNGYNSGPPTWFATFNSNDNSSFVFTNSDSQGSGASSVTRTRLTSPPIDLTGYTAANASFFHYFRWIGATDICRVQVTIDGGTNWTTIANYNSTQGTSTNFLQSFLNLNPYTGNIIQIRFDYQSNWGWGWAVDNFKVVGSAASSIVWTPTTGLYNDAAGTSAYVAGTGAAIVYAVPTADVVYTATATAPGPTFCESTQTVAVTVTPQVGGTLSANQVVCDTTLLNNITLAGSVGNVIRWEYADDVAFTVGVTPIANTTTTLTPAEFGTFPTIRYFRAVVGAGICNPVFSTIASVTIPTTIQSGTSPADVWSNGTPDITKRVIITGNYTVNADISACSIEVLLGATMTVTNNATVTIENGLKVNPMALPNSVVFENNTSLIQNSTSNTVNSGSIRYIRNSTPIIQFDYTYWSSPVDNQIIKIFSPNTTNARFFTFNSSPGVYAWAVVPSVTTHVMDAAKGYIIRAPNNISTTVPAAWPGEFYGRPRNGSYSLNVFDNGLVAGVDQNRNLLGNPYPSAIDADQLWSENSAQLTGNFYFWTHNTPSNGQVYLENDYASYNASGGTGTSASASGLNNSAPNGFIAAGQGFFAEALSSGTVTFNNTIRVAGNNGLFFRNANQSIERHRVWLNVINNQGAFKQTLVGYIEGATNDRDTRFDGEFVEVGNTVALYSLLNQDKLTIQGRALPFVDTDEIPLGFKTTVAGTFEIQLADFDGLFDQGQAIYLEDKVLNVIHDLRESNYSFTTAVGTFEERFELQFLNGTLGVPTFNEEGVVVYKNNQTIFINTGVTLMKEVKIFDIRGRLVAEKTSINATDVQFSNLNTAQQVLLVQITTEEGVVVTKKVIY